MQCFLLNFYHYSPQESSKKIVEANGYKEIPLIFWNSQITSPEYLTKYLDPNKHVIQIWSKTTDKQIPNIAEKGFKMIFSTYNTLYLDCGYGNWLTEVSLFSMYACMHACARTHSKQAQNARAHARMQAGMHVLMLCVQFPIILLNFIKKVHNICFS